MKRVGSVAALLVVVSALCGALVLKSGGAKASPTHAASATDTQSQPSVTACARWTVVPSPNAAGFNSDGLSGVAAVAADDVWAVGGAGDQRTGGQTLIEHWNGTSWSIVSNPSPGTAYNFLYSATAVSASDVWAVGVYASTPGLTQTLIEHWDGASWSVVASPNPGTSNNELFSVSADAANDIWAVGFTSNVPNGNQSSPDQTLIEHWNGSKWSVARSLNPGTSSDHLEGVAAISSTDVWAVGTGVTDAGQTLTEHWNGSKWSVVASPSPSSGGDLRAVSAASSDDVWAVGQYITTMGQTLTEHWNGTSWSVVTSPNVGSSPAFWSVAALSSGDVWAVGSDTNSTGTIQTLAAQWDGSRWGAVKNPSPGSFVTQLEDVAAISAADVWAVGHADNTTLIEHYACP